MIISLTVNPAVDQTAWVDRLQPGATHRVQQTHIDPAGKGINVSRMIHRLGWPTIAFGFLAGDTGNIVEKSLDTEGVQHQFIRIPGQTRVNVTVVDRQGVATGLLSAGPSVPPESLATLDSLISFWLQGGRVLVVAGSLAPGIAEDAYAGYVRAARDCGVKVILDTHGEPLRRGIAAQPDLIKPNVAEAEELLGRRLPDAMAVIGGAQEIAERGVGIVVISMGAEGAICVHGQRTWRILPPKIKRRSTVGSGDAMVAGLATALARGESIEAGLRLGTAAGAATAMTEGTALGTLADTTALLAQVHVEELS
jgi:1-phosphofructokinase family hexose kinase